MIKTNLPVILLRGILLLPNNDIRLEFDNDDSKNIIDVSELFHNNHVFVVCQESSNETININDLSKKGVIGKISHKMELPNGKIRIIIMGLKRAEVIEYLNLTENNNVLESIISEIKPSSILEKEETVFIRKIKREVKNYSKTIPYGNNNIIGSIEGINNLNTLTDVLAPQLLQSIKRLKEYLYTNNPVLRAKMILDDINSELEMFNIEKEIDFKVKKEIDSNQKEYILREKMRLIKEELGESAPKDDDIINFRNILSKLKINNKTKTRIELEINRYDGLNPTSPESNIIRTYIEWMLNLPWNKFTKDNNNLDSVKTSLDESHYGLDKVKTRIIEFLAVKQMTNSLKGPIICLVGPPGVGKTSLAFSIASAMNRKFVKMSVGGVNDEAEIMGHRRTYIGANPGRIIQSLKKAGSSNPVFLIDEIDKMTRDIKGDPASALLEVLDPEQNKYFSDNYIEEEYDLSKVLFIATANYLEDIPEALKDRLEIVRLSGYTEYEKLDIAKRHLIPKLHKEHGLNKTKVIFSDEIILYIIRNYTKEAGVRELDRQLATIIRKIVTEIVIAKSKCTWIKLSKITLKKYLGREKYHFSNFDKIAKVGVVNGLAYTYFGGDTLPIEVNYYKGNGSLILTGSLGDVMKESAKISLSYIKANYQLFKIDYDKLINNDIHINVPEGAIPKDGPSAGVALTTALISSLTGKKVSSKIAMTGEITLRGKVLPIGGLKEKSIGAHRNGINKIIIPFDNINDLEEVPEEVKKDIEYIPIKDYKEISKIINETL